MADQQEFSDDELLRLYKNPASDLSKLTSGELKRLDALTATQAKAPDTATLTPEQINHSWIGRTLQGAADKLSKITDNPGASAAGTAIGVTAGPALSAAGGAVRAVSQTIPPSVSKGGMMLANILLGGKAKFALKVASALAEHAGPLTEGTTATVPLAEEASTQTIAQRLARIPIQGRLDQIAGQGANEVAAQSLKAGADTLAGDVGIIRSTIARRLATPAEAIKLAAAGNDEYAAALKKAYLESVDRLGLPKPFVPKSVVDLMKSESFQKLPKP